MVEAKDCLTCTFCRRSFTRGDALKRHWKTCRIRRDCALALPAHRQKTRGRKPRACDTCSRMKRACTANKPCKPCIKRGHGCTYSRLDARSPQDDNDPTTLNSNELSPFDLSVYECVEDRLDKSVQLDGSPREDEADDFSLLPLKGTRSEIDTTGCDITWAIYDEYSLTASFSHRPTEIDLEVLFKFPFLANFTTTTGFARSFECGSPDRRFSIIQDWSSSKAISTLLPGRTISDEIEMNWIEVVEAALLRTSDFTSNISNSSLMTKTHEIVAFIRETTIHKSRRSIISSTWSPYLEAVCYEFFHPNSIQKHLALFWACWYPNWPTIHRPTFHTPNECSSLVAAMCIVGACLSTEDRDRAMAHLWFDIVEELVFDNDIFVSQDPGSAWQESEKLNHRRDQLSILQAAYCVCLYQTWEGGIQSRKRVLRHRFSTLVFLIRDIGLENASLRTVDTSDLASFDWIDYITRESLIRISTYIYAIDSAFAQFYHHPPRMLLSEMNVDLTSSDHCFAANSVEECFVELKTWRSSLGSIGPSLTVVSSVKLLYDTSISNVGRQAFEKLSVLNMFTIISALYAETYRLETSLVRPFATSEISTLSTALRQWKEQWPSTIRDAELAGLQLGSMSTSSSSPVGFMRHAPEYWLLTHLILEPQTHAVWRLCVPRKASDAYNNYRTAFSQPQRDRSVENL